MKLSLTSAERFVVIDCETTVAKVGDDHDPRPFVVDKATWTKPHAFKVGWQQVGFANVTIADSAPKLEPGRIYVGHNLKFDALHLPELREHPCWCTMIAEYVLTAQQTKFASLASLIERYVPGGAKPDLIGDNLDRGISPDMIPEAELNEYLANDVQMTGAVFRAQWDRATPAQRHLIVVLSTASMVYAEIESNGLWLDMDRLHERRQAAEDERLTLLGAIEDCWRVIADDLGPLLRGLDALTTNRTLSLWFFGGSAEHQVPLTDAEKAKLPKSRKWKTVKITSPTGRMGFTLDPTAYGATMNAKTRIWQVGEEVLTAIKAGSADPMGLHKSMADLVLKYRAVDKLLGTYYEPWLKDVEKYGEPKLHTTINTTLTNTGRTSSSGPNIQNIPGEAREVIKTRFPEGVLVEADTKQLEICGLAYVSQCSALRAAITRGDDIHTLTGSRVFKGPAMTAEQRLIVKRINFGLIYGAGAQTLAAQTGQPLELCQELLESFYATFPGVKPWQKATYEKVTRNPDHVEVVPSDEGGTKRVLWLKTNTGRAYAFPEEPYPGKPLAPKPTKVKNYPIQGFSTGDVVPLFLVLLRAQMRNVAPDALVINAVHDSVLIDCPNSSVGELVREVITLTGWKGIPKALQDLWGIDLGVPIKLDIKLKTYWKED